MYKTFFIIVIFMMYLSVIFAMVFVFILSAVGTAVLSIIFNFLGKQGFLGNLYPNVRGGMSSTVTAYRAK